MRIAWIALLACLFPFVAATAQEEQLSPYQWQQAQKVAFDKSEKVYADALKRNGLLAQYKAMRDAYRSDKGKAFRIVFGQYMSWYQSFVGDYPGAHDSYSIRQLASSDDASSPLSGGYTPKSALDAVAELAKGRKAIFFNEAHNVPLTRTLTVELLSKLRAEGYTYFAAETLYASDADLQKRGYPVPASGFYTMEPISAEMVRTALQLGFKVVAYESEKPGNGDVREYDQAKNLNERVFKHDPDARLVVNAGYAHIQENGKYLGGKSMAQHFRKLTGIDPLTIEQTMLIEHPPGTENHPYYRAVIDSLHPKEPIVFEGKNGKPWSLKPGAYEVSVFFPPDELRDERPTWLDLGGLRKPYSVNGSMCQNEYPCLIEARYAKEGDDAIPADRLVLDPVKAAERLEERLIQRRPQTHGDLYLRPGTYRITGLATDNRTLFRQEVVIGDKAQSAQTAAQ
ncbi:hypothetical protein GCM10009105_21010 [Dokdonella soli]|uniref:Uncharacterized protein n=2 Tax=Dokdonella soli TaxID=529810 RepID=A0ABP3TQ60_9GAMM